MVHRCDMNIDLQVLMVPPSPMGLSITITLSLYILYYFFSLSSTFLTSNPCFFSPRALPYTTYKHLVTPETLKHIVVGSLSTHHFSCSCKDYIWFEWDLEGQRDPKCDDLTRVWTHDQCIMTEHFMPLRHVIQTTQPSVTSLIQKQSLHTFSFYSHSLFLGTPISDTVAKLIFLEHFIEQTENRII